MPVSFQLCSFLLLLLTTTRNHSDVSSWTEFGAGSRLWCLSLVHLPQNYLVLSVLSASALWPLCSGPIVPSAGDTRCSLLASILAASLTLTRSYSQFMFVPSSDLFSTNHPVDFRNVIISLMSPPPCQSKCFIP